jgi:hypothetical protein
VPQFDKVDKNESAQDQLEAKVGSVKGKTAILQNEMAVFSIKSNS